MFWSKNKKNKPPVLLYKSGVQGGILFHGHSEEKIFVNGERWRSALVSRIINKTRKRNNFFLSFIFIKYESIYLLMTTSSIKVLLEQRLALHLEMSLNVI